MPINSLRICFETLKVLKKGFMSKPMISLNINSFYIGRTLDLHAERGRLGREEPSEINCILWWMSVWSTSVGPGTAAWLSKGASCQDKANAVSSTDKSLDNLIWVLKKITA